MIAPETIALISEWTETHQGGINPLHEVVDVEKYETLVADMEENGWKGAPLVVECEQALTGSHRYWAATETFTGIPRIDVTDLCDLFDADWDTLKNDHGGDWWEAARYLDEVLPREVVDYLGLDLH